jgi:hypothetical protein
LFRINYKQAGIEDNVVLTHVDTPPMFPERRVTPTIKEGQSAVLTGRIFEPDPLDTFILDVLWGDGTPLETYTFPPGTPRDVSISHPYAEDGTYSISLAWRDQHGLGNSGVLSVKVKNVPPKLQNLQISSPVSVGQIATLTGLISDPGVQDTFTIVVNWGDGSARETYTYPAGTTDFSLTHAFQKHGKRKVTLTVFDDDGGSSSADIFVWVDR